MEELSNAALAGVEDAAKDLLNACVNVRKGSEGVRGVLEAARGVYLGAMELTNTKLSEKEEEPREFQSVPLWVYDDLVDTSDASRSLTQAIECATVVSRASIADPGDFLTGTLDVLLAASDDAFGRVAVLRDKVAETRSQV